MRSSDWSSDVCSSDLQAAYEHRLARWRLQDDLALAGLLAAQGRSVRVLIPFVLRSHRPLLSAVTTRSARARFLFSVVPLEAHAGIVGASAGHLAFQGVVRRQLDFHAGSRGWRVGALFHADIDL